MLFALILDRDANAFIEKSLFAQAFGQFVETELDRVEDLRVRFKSDLGAPLFCLARLLQIAGPDATFELLLVGLTVPPDFDVERLGKKIDHGNADAVQAAGNLVSVRIELAAGMQLGHHDLGC